MTKFCFTLALSTVVLLAASSEALADLVNPFAPMSGYNVMVFGDYTQKGPGDTEGRLAVQNNMTTMNNYGVGQYVGADPTRPNLVVGGTLSTTGAWKVFNGNAYYGNSTSANPVSYDGAYGRVYEHSLNFEKAYNDMSGYSKTFAEMQATGTFEAKWGGSYIEAGHGIQVVNVDLASLYHSGDTSNFGWGLNITGYSDTQLVINIIGSGEYTDLNISGGIQLMGGLLAENLIYNFVNVDTVTMQNASIAGNILAVDTALTLGNGNIEGYAAFGDITTLSGGEFHNKFMFNGEYDLPTNPETPPQAATPEPATMMIFGIGLLSLPFLNRRRNQVA